MASTPHGVYHPEKTTDMSLETILADMAMSVDVKLANVAAAAGAAALLQQAADQATQAAQDAQDAQDAATAAAALVGAPAGAAIDAHLGATDGDLSKIYAKGMSTAAFGVTGNGTTDDTAAMQTAVNTAATFGFPLSIPHDATIGLASRLDLPAGLNLATNGATFTMTSPFGTAAVRIFDNVTITGGLRLDTITTTSTRGITCAGNNITIDHARITAPTPGAGSGSNLNIGLQITGASNVTIGHASVTNYDYPVQVINSDHTTIGYVSADTYKRGLHIDGSSYVHIRGGHIRGASPNATYAAGHNGVLQGQDTTPATDIRIENLTVADAGEHGYRFAGAALRSNLWVTNCVARNVGGSGFKVLGGTIGDTAYNDNINFSHCVAEDCGQASSNMCGFLIQLCRNVTLTNVTVRGRNKPVAADEGIRMSGVSDVSVMGAQVRDSGRYAFHLDSTLGNVERVHVVGLDIDTTGPQGVYLECSAVTFRDIHIEARVATGSSSGSALYAGPAGGSAGTWANLNTARLVVADGVYQAVHPATVTAALIGEITGPKNTSALLRDGSTWADTTTGTKHLAKAGAWVAL